MLVEDEVRPLRGHQGSERAALPPRTGRWRRPGVRARPRSEASPLRDSAGISPASLGTAPAQENLAPWDAGSLSQPAGHWARLAGYRERYGPSISYLEGPGIIVPPDLRSPLQRHAGKIGTEWAAHGNSGHAPASFARTASPFRTAEDPGKARSLHELHSTRNAVYSASR